MKSVEFAPAARAEFDAAADRYEEERPGRGIRFIAAVERTVKLIVRFPDIGPLFPGVRSELGVLGDTIRIDAVAHMHRRPAYWRRRVR